MPFPDLPDHYRDVSRIVHFGMGGSAIAADYLQTVVTGAERTAGGRIPGVRVSVAH